MIPWRTGQAREPILVLLRCLDNRRGFLPVPHTGELGVILHSPLDNAAAGLLFMSPAAFFGDGVAATRNS